MFKKLVKFFKECQPKTFWMVDDNTCMPIACDTYERALEIVNKDFNGEIDRIYTSVKV